MSDHVWQYGLWSFQTGDTKLERFLPKNQHTRRKLLNFEFWINGELSKSAKIWLSKSIFYVKNHPNVSQFFFSLKNTILGAHFLLLIFFDKINFNFLITKMMPYIWQLTINPKLKIQSFPLGMWILMWKSVYLWINSIPPVTFRGKPVPKIAARLAWMAIPSCR